MGNTHPYLNHLQELEDDLRAYLEVQAYIAASPKEQLEMRQRGMMPGGWSWDGQRVVANVEPPEPYLLWRRSKHSALPWWSGGLSDQPHVLMIEFDVCASVCAEMGY